MALTLNDLKKYEESLMQNVRCLANSFDGVHCSCNGSTIGSHSIAKQAILSKIAENGEVYVWEQNATKMHHYHEISDGRNHGIELAKWGVKKASVFPGFCKYHDETLFNRIDAPIQSFDQEVLLQMHYRAISYEYYYKKNGAELIEYTLDNSAYDPAIDQVLCNFKLGLSDLELEKRTCENAYINKNENNVVKAVIYSFDTAIPVVCVSSWTPCHTINGEPFFESLEEEQAPSIGLTLGMDANNNAFWAITYTRYDKYVKKFLDNLDSYRNKRLLDIAILFSLQFSQNACCRPSWFDNLQKWQKANIVRNYNRLSEYDFEPVTGIRILKELYKTTKIL